MRRASKLPWLLVGGLMALGAARAQEEAEPPEFPDFAETVAKWTPQEGFIRLYRKADDESALLGAVPADLLQQPFFLATSVAGGTEYAGWQWVDTLVRFERLGKKLLLVELNTRQRAAEGKPVFEVVRRTYADRLLAEMDIKSIGPAGEILVDLGALLIGDYGTFFGGEFSLNTGVARVTTTKTFTRNAEIAVQMPDRGEGTFVTLHYSLSHLPPLEEYTPRVADDRIGYFLTAIRDYTGGDPREGRMIRLVDRWKLEKADPELPLSPPKEPIVFYVEKTVPIEYRRAVAQGILEWNKAFEAIGISGAIEVRQQTETQFADLDPEDVNYNFFRWITSETPFAMGPSRVDPRSGRILDADIIFDDSMLRGYLHDYDVLIREAPEKMLSAPMQRYLQAHPERHPMVAIRAREGDLLTERARGLVREVLAEERRAAAAPTARRARRPEQDACSLGEGMTRQIDLFRLAFGDLAAVAGTSPKLDEYLAQIVKETVMHEVGHTLGLRHNFKASSLYDLDQINSADKPPALSASVMDYHPINISTDPARPQGNFLSTTLGPYDMLAIEYGYALVEEGSDELKAIPRRMAEKGLPYATDEDTTSPDPLIARWDLGNDPVKFADYRLQLVRKMWGDLEARAVSDDESYSKLRRALSITLFEVGNSAQMVARLVGGLGFSRDHRGDPQARPPIDVVPAARQRQALEWVVKNLFAPDAFSFSPELLAKLAASRWSDWSSSDEQASLDYPLLDKLLTIQTWALFFLTADDVLARLWENELRVGSKGDALTLPELFDQLEPMIFAELKEPKAGASARDPLVTSMRQNLQDAYVRRLIEIALGNGISPPVANKLAWSRLEALERRFAGLLDGAKLDPYTQAHLAALKAKSEQARTARYVHIASGGCALATPGQAGRPWAPLGLLALLAVAVRRRRSAA